MWVKYGPDWAKGIKFCLDLHILLKTCFKVTAHPLAMGTLWVKYEAGWAKGREDREEISDEQKDGQTDHYRAPAKRGPNYYKMLKFAECCGKNPYINPILN